MQGWKLYRDVIIIAAGFALLGYLFSFRPLYALAGAVLLVSIHPAGARLVVKLWRKFGAALGYVNSRILLTVFFFLVVTPFALIYRLLRNKKSLDASKWKSSGNTKVDFTQPW